MPSLDALHEAMRGRLAEAGISTGAGIPSRTHRDHAPMSFTQESVWRHQQEVPDSTANNITLTFAYTGEVDEKALRRAMHALVRRHEILRTTYHGDESQAPHQRIHDELPSRTDLEDLRDHPEPDLRLRELVSSLATEPFDLSAEPSIRLSFVSLPRDSEGRARLVMIVAMQHIIWDGMTLPVMARDVRRAYIAAIADPDRDPPSEHLTPQVADVAEWERARFDRDDHSDDERFWREILVESPPAEAVVPDHRPDEVGERSARVDRLLSATAEASLRELSAALRTTPFSVFLAAYQVALSRLTGRDEFMVGTTVANREYAGLENVIGNFSNPVVLRLRRRGDTFGDLVGHVRRVIDGAFAHRELPFDRVSELAVEVAPHLAPRPFDSMVLFLDQEITGIELPDCDMSWELADKGKVALPLTIEAFMHAAHTEIQISYQVDLFESATIERLHDELDDILANATVDRPIPSAPIERPNDGK